MQVLDSDTSAQTSAPNQTRNNFMMNYTTTGGFAPTFKSIIYNSSDNIIIEIGGFSKHIEGERKLTSKERELLENIIIKNNFFQTSLQDYSPCCDLKYFNLTITFDKAKNSVMDKWHSVPDNILKIVGTFENLTSYKNES